MLLTPRSFQIRVPARVHVTALFAGAIAGALTSAGCRSDAPPATAADATTARLQIINAVRSPVDVLVDGSVRVSALQPAGAP